MKQFTCFFFIATWMIWNVLGKEDTLSDKIQQLTDWSLKKPVIRLNNENFKHFVRTAPKNYSIIVMLTALSPQRQCAVCKQAHDEYQVAAQSYRYSKEFSNKLFFAMVDFDEGSEVFQYLKLNTAPVFIHFPAKMKPKKSDHMDVGRRGFSAENLINWINERADVHIQVFRPPNYSRLLLIALFVIMTASLLYVKRNSLGFLSNHIIWGVIMIVVVCYFISGQTWNLINGPPFKSNRQDGTGMFASDSNMQYIGETYIVFLLYFGVSVGMILLNEAPKVKSQKGKRKTFMAVFGIITVILLFSFLLSIFRAKYQGYPYSFLIK